MKSFREKVIVRGGGDLATGIIYRLMKAGCRVLVLEITAPAAIRRQVSFCEAIYEGQCCVEEITAVRIQDLSECDSLWEQGMVPVMVDPSGNCIKDFAPDFLVDAILAKKNLGTTMEMAPVTIGIGPGFEAGKDVHFVVESMRGHNLGRIITEGSALPDTKIPGNIAGYTKERVIHAPAQGKMKNICQIGDFVEKGQVIAVIEEEESMESQKVFATIPGFIRGLIRDGYPVTKGFKIADIDPRADQRINCFTISDKARCIAGSVLEILCQQSSS